MSDFLERAAELLAQAQEEQTVAVRDSQVARHEVQQCQTAHEADVQRCEARIRELEGALVASEAEAVSAREALQRERTDSAAASKRHAAQVEALTAERDQALAQRDSAINDARILGARCGELENRPVALEQAESRAADLQREFDTTQRALQREQAMREGLTAQLAKVREAHEIDLANAHRSHAIEVHQHKRRLEQMTARLDAAAAELTAQLVRADAAERRAEGLERATRDHAARAS